MVGFSNGTNLSISHTQRTLSSATSALCFTVMTTGSTPSAPNLISAERSLSVFFLTTTLTLVETTLLSVFSTEVGSISIQSASQDAVQERLDLTVNFTVLPAPATVIALSLAPDTVKVS